MRTSQADRDDDGSRDGDDRGDAHSGDHDAGPPGRGRPLPILSRSYRLVPRPLHPLPVPRRPLRWLPARSGLPSRSDRRGATRRIRRADGRLPDGRGNCLLRFEPWRPGRPARAGRPGSACRLRKARRLGKRRAASRAVPLRATPRMAACRAEPHGPSPACADGGRARSGCAPSASAGLRPASLRRHHQHRRIIARPAPRSAAH